ncbi:metal-tetracycline/H(+) antiporter [Oceanobacillus picturae]|uniref:Metal-tetracycline/H(+) antiporter n=2 Tax=Oceanobacillus picturae TaxID=171693 RepID=W9AFL0_9BACI|nr:metal-tetracycline/H(+) antiporter [Oceanobacillus picturae]CDO04504.1 Metal-tetracycline/H(+) antiporter [Oceanobacillus picturae]
MVLPFISLYIESLGNFSDAYVQNWSGWIFAITFVSAFLFSPIWGRIGDKYGRKRILIILAIGLGLSVFLMGYATTVWQLFLLRLFMGIVTGFIPMSQAFISTQTPKEIAGKVLGTLQTGSITGTLMGPLLGGVLADAFGYASTFKWVSLTVFLSAIIVFFGIKELNLRISEDDSDYKSYSSKEVILHIIRKPVLLVVMLISVLVQIAHFSIQPILSLFVAEIHGPASIAFFSGMAFSAAGLGNLLMTRRWGRLGDRIGYIKILIFLLFMAGIVYLPGAFVTNIWQLVVLRFLLGISIGGIIPVRIAYIRQEAPLSMQGEVLGYNTSLRFLGNIIGPALGGALSGFFGFSSVFVVTSVLLIISGVIMLVTWYKHEYSGGHSHSFSASRH